MLDLLVRHWWLVALRGALALVFGLIALIWPAITVLALVIVFGAYAIADGLVALVAAFRRRDLVGGDRGWLIVQGVLSVIAGVLAFIWPGVTALVLLVLIAAWLIVTGVIQVTAALRLRRVLRNEWMLLIAGLLSLIAGIILIVQPAEGAIALVWVIGLFAILFGIAQLILGFRLRGLSTRMRPA